MAAYGTRSPIDGCEFIERGAPWAAVAEFLAWLEKSRQGDGFTYHNSRHERFKDDQWCGVYESNNKVRRTTQIFVNTPGGAAHAAYVEGKVSLVQRRVDDGTIDYIAVRR